MCGIAGAIGSLDADVLAAVERMSGAQAHRGPDQSGFYASTERGPGVAFGHRRLSILDLSEAGRQPMVERASGVAIVFNGEVYNFAELKKELELDVRSGTDTEVILAAYVRKGEEVVTRLRGMFAFAIWDPRERSVLLARDRLGIKPLYFAQQEGAFLFASELRALLASGRIDRRLDPASMASFLWNGFVPGPNTIVPGIRLLAAGTCMRIGLDGRAREPKRYWSVPRHAPVRTDDAVEALGEALSDAVRMRLVADVPLGIFLSGGVDSSAVAALAQRSARSPLSTFTIRFEEARFDESAHARKVADVLGTDHQEITLTGSSFADHLDDALASIDQPTFDAINTYFVSRAVKDAGLTVALAGTGGDELFGGYPSFVDLPRARAVSARLSAVPEPALRRAARIATLFRTASEVQPQTRWGKLGDVLATRGDRLGLYQASYALFSRELWTSLSRGFGDHLDNGLSPERASELRQAIAGEPDRSAVSRLELESFLGERLLRDTDAASMAVSLEVRVPLIDHRVVEALAAVPESTRYEPLGKKALLRRLVARELDPRLFDRPKAGFELPLEAWCRQRLGPTLRATFEDVVHAHRVGLDGEVVARIWRSFAKGGAGLYWSRVWALFVLMWWCRAHRVYL